MIVETLPTDEPPSVLGSAILNIVEGADPVAIHPQRRDSPDPGHPGRLRSFWLALRAGWHLLWSSRSMQPGSLELIIASWAVLLYIVTRLWAIDSFPIFFYSDEANNVWYGERSLQHGLVGEDKAWPAIYIEWDTNRWTPSLSMYGPALAAMLFGNTIFVARATSAVITLLGVLAIALILKEFFRSRFWWAGILLAISVPAWFLYSRTVFDTVAATSLYAAFLFVYMLYRYRSPRYLVLAAILGAAAFYSYSNMQAEMALLAAGLFLSDLRYHAANRQAWLRASPVLALLAIPFTEFRVLHPSAIADHLRAVDSYWVGGLSLAAKLGQYAKTYLVGLSPVYWFAPENGEDNILPVQHIPGAGNLGLIMLPLLALGLYASLRNIRSPLHRTVLLALVVVPAGGAMDTIEITRVLALVVPALILAVLGLEFLSSQVRRIPHSAQAAIVVIALSALGIFRLRSALVYGPTWYDDYGLFGMQFGAKQVFEETVPHLLAQDPKASIVMTTTWANNPDQYPRFFLSPAEQRRIAFGNVHDFLAEKLTLDPKIIIGMTPPEYADAAASPVIGRIDVVKTINSPDGKPAFYFAHLAYADNADQIFHQMMVERQQPVEDTVVVNGQEVIVLHSKLGDGEIANLFDGSVDTLVRGAKVNPFRIELRFPQPISINDLALTLGSMPDFTVTILATSTLDSQEVSFEQRYVGLGPDPTVRFHVSSPGAYVSTIQVQITDNVSGPDAMIHVRELTLH